VENGRTKRLAACIERFYTTRRSVCEPDNERKLEILGIANTLLLRSN
jgi:hypothetical protein